jgi:hypothetical protein
MLLLPPLPPPPPLLLLLLLKSLMNGTTPQLKPESKKTQTPTSTITKPLTSIHAQRP